ncbi:MAG: hypothetical protein ABIP94_19740, partial [Planctomycetota bacterium]
MNVLSTCVLVVCSSVLADLPAQKLLASDGSGRVVQMFDAQKLRTTDEPVGAPMGEPVGKPKPADNESMQKLADFLRRFIEPPLGPQDDLRALGGRWLVLLGSPAQVASVERLFAIATARQREQLDIRIHIVKMKAANFVRTLQPRLTAVERDQQTTYETVVPSAQATDLLAEIAASDSERMEAPRVLVQPLQVATIASVDQTSYIQDFTLERSANALIANPVIGVTWDGVQNEVQAILLPDGTIGVACDVHVQELQKPM